MKETLFYTLKVWISSVVLGPVMYSASDILFEPKRSDDFSCSLSFIAFSVPYGLILSVPSFVILWLTTYGISRLKLSIMATKLWLSIVGTVLTALPFALIFGHDDPSGYLSTIAWATSYSLVIVVGIWFYKLKLAITIT